MSTYPRGVLVVTGQSWCGKSHYLRELVRADSERERYSIVVTMTDDWDKDTVDCTLKSAQECLKVAELHNIRIAPNEEKIAYILDKMRDCNFVVDEARVVFPTTQVSPELVRKLREATTLWRHRRICLWFGAQTLATDVHRLVWNNATYIVYMQTNSKKEVQHCTAHIGDVQANERLTLKQGEGFWHGPVDTPEFAD